LRFDPQTILVLVLLLPSITFHEYMHAYAAYKLGDPTAKNAGRLTLNPIAHIDPIGTVILPLLLFVSGGFLFGYAKPVPINPRYFKDVRKGDLITGFAGPSANLMLALGGALIAWAAVALVGTGMSQEVAQWTYLVGAMLVRTNLVLMFFNLLPIPPLDGSSIVPMFLPDSALSGWFRLQRYSFGILLVLLLVIPSITGFSPLSSYFEVTVSPLMRLLLPG
jgi:Zn-dependent protease